LAPFNSINLELLLFTYLVSAKNVFQFVKSTDQVYQILTRNISLRS